MTKRTSAGVTAAATLLCVALGVPDRTQAQGDFDPAEPFAGVTAAGDWQGRFATEAPADPADPFHNLTSGQWWNRTWNGQWTDAHASGKTFEEFWAGLQGDNHNSAVIRSPYPYTSAEEHWNAWALAAQGGVVHTRETLPDWSGDWDGSTRLVTAGNAQVADVWAAVSDDWKPRFEQILQAELEARHWWPADGCLPNGFMRDGWTMRYIMLDTQVALIAEDQPLTEYRVIYHDGRGFPPDDLRYPQWYGSSQGFWDGDELVVWTRDIIPWNGSHGLPEHSEQLEIIERWKRIGDELLVDVVLYDPLAFAHPWHDVGLYRKRDWTNAPPTHNECVSTNNVYHDELGRIADFGPEDPRYYDIFDPRPWATVFEMAEAAKAQGLLPAAPSFRSLAPAP